AAANAIRSAGVEAGDRYGILAYNCVEFLAFFFAAAKCGAIVVPLSTRATAHELRGIVEDCAMNVLFVGEEFANIDLPTRVLPLRAAEGTCDVLRSDPESIYCLLYTSGTTGKPKGVMLPKRQLWWNGYNTAINWGLREDDVSPIFTPLYHAGGVAAFLIPIFSIGGTIVLHKNFDANVVWQLIQRERCTVVLGVPTIWKLLMDAPGFATANLDHVRWFISGGAPLPTYIQQAYLSRGVPMKQGYGMTEVGVNCFTMTVEDAARKPGSIGTPMMFTEVRLDDSDGEVGEMLIRGPHVSKGYWNNDEATRAAYGDDGWFRTGDLARRDADGFFYIAGRRKEMFISGGVNVYPAEIEAELVTHPLVADAAIVPVADETWGEVAVAFIVGSAEQHELETYLATRIAKYKLPRRYIFVDALPRTPYGKVEKSKLREAIH
ncbi:MAG TPA: AMP-binding protein, partial [Thermoanaerobaculia bacterium]|nr:AMP-binding protein [Thermoanaerobaculia bacterium]